MSLGHGLELDCQNPHSQPVQFFWGAAGFLAGVAGFLAEIGCNTPEHPILKRFLAYLEACPDITEQDIRFAIPSNNEYPCNPWYRFAPGQTPAECNINSSISFIFEHSPPASALYQKALRIADYRLSVMRGVLIARLEATKDIWQGLEPSDYASLILALQKHRFKTERECRALYDRLLDIVKEYGTAQTYAMLAKQIGDGTGLCHMDEITGDDELDAAVDALSGDDQPWNTCGRLRAGEDSAQKYAEMYHIGSPWWPVKNAIQSMKLLKADGRIEEPGFDDRPWLPARKPILRQWSGSQSPCCRAANANLWPTFGLPPKTFPPRSLKLRGGFSEKSAPPRAIIARGG